MWFEYYTTQACRSISKEEPPPAAGGRFFWAISSKRQSISIQYRTNRQQTKTVFTVPYTVINFPKRATNH